MATMDFLLATSQHISSLLEDSQVSHQYLCHFLRQARQESLNVAMHPDWPEPVKRVAQALADLQISQVSRIYHVASDYYSWPLYQRALCMTVPSTKHMCKSVIMENKRWRPEHPGSRFYCVMVQYLHSVDTNSMADYVRALGGDKIARKHFNFRLTSPESTLEMTGFDKNGVCPFGTPVKMPIILCQSISLLKPPVFWIGAGHVDFKLAMSIQSFIDATNCLLADISVLSDKDQ
ncbi:hypothetical protein J3B02_003369 [Coemansia erecta]|uniref:YbaK/aminoacyl-tRNA synthetase-associated domain-containing protein n=1 Tax=Coemansia asiatica TaxID=1052880 RepID=A0A9W7XCQ6_9FUNG|nr:hypothetical protein LPJ64_006318 [Coemansia asiatica]KAJ2852911.1 hypothetical protein J3B02_003369 [Coemansia erecta]